MRSFALIFFLMLGTGVQAKTTNLDLAVINTAVSCGDYGDDSRRTKRIKKRRKRKCKRFAKSKLAG
jgi:hypothetical protein